MEYICPRCRSALRFANNVIDASEHFPGDPSLNPDDIPGLGLKCDECELEITNDGRAYHIEAA